MNSSSFAGRRLTLTLADDRIRVPAGIQPGERFGDTAIVAIRLIRRRRALVLSPRTGRLAQLGARACSRPEGARCPNGLAFGDRPAGVVTREGRDWPVVRDRALRGREAGFDALPKRGAAGARCVRR
jgi:hypothetical protein